MMVWKLILDPKNPSLTINEVAATARTLGYPMFNYDGKIHKLTENKPDQPAQFAETGSVPEMFHMPTIYCVMDGEKKKIATNDFGPVLFADPIAAQMFAEHVGGVSKSLNEAIYLQREAQKNASALIVPDRPGLIVPGK